MLAVTSIARRVPMIRFRYYIAKNGGQPYQFPAAVAAAGSGLLDSFAALPAHLRPRVMSELEQDVVMMGGAGPYSLKKKGKK